MTRSVSAGMLNHLAGETTTVATCWKLTRRDGEVMGFTNHDEDITFDSVDYISASGFMPSQVALKSDFSVSNLEVQGVIDSSYITEEDLMTGKYDYAEVAVFLINYADTSMGVVTLNSGFLGEITISKGQFVGEIRGLSQHVSQKIGQIYSPTCRAVLGDSRCTVDLAPHLSATSITTVIDSITFYSSDLDISFYTPSYFTHGYLTFTSGSNEDLRMEIKDFLDGVITLALPMPSLIVAGDQFTAAIGCDKQFSTCRDLFGNAVNFRGEPDIPGQDKILETAGTFDAGDTTESS